jgi:pentatricopeptide repeat protein
MAFWFSPVLKAWADSGCTNAPEKIHSILDKMKQRDVKKSHITFSILLRFWAGRTDVSMVEHLLASMSVEGLPPNRTALSSVIYCYCKKGETDKAESVFRDFLDVEPTNSVERNMLGECAQSLMMAYRNIIDSASSNKYRNDRVLENVETFYKRVQNHPDLEEESEGKSFHIAYCPPIYNWKAHRPFNICFSLIKRS